MELCKKHFSKLIRVTLGIVDTLGTKPLLWTVQLFHSTCRWRLAANWRTGEVIKRCWLTRALSKSIRHQLRDAPRILVACCSLMSRRMIIQPGAALWINYKHASHNLIPEWQAIVYISVGLTTEWLIKFRGSLLSGLQTINYSDYEENLQNKRGMA